MAQKESGITVRPRGRPRAYDPALALARATEAFWQSGFSATSLDALAAATGMNRPSIYGAFGDKHALYLAALTAYTEQAVMAMAEALAPGRPLRDGLRRVYDAALKLYFPPDAPPRGCLLIGTAATESVNDDAIRGVLRAALRRFDAAFETRLAAAVADGELPEGSDPAMLARVASALLHSLALRSRAGDARSTLRATVNAGIALICGPEAPA